MSTSSRNIRKENTALEDTENFFGKYLEFILTYFIKHGTIQLTDVVLTQ